MKVACLARDTIPIRIINKFQRALFSRSISLAKHLASSVPSPQSPSCPVPSDAGSFHLALSSFPVDRRLTVAGALGTGTTAATTDGTLSRRAASRCQLVRVAIACRQRPPVPRHSSALNCPLRRVARSNPSRVSLSHRGSAEFPARDSPPRLCPCIIQRPVSVWMRPHGPLY